ncbi:B-cell receptor-associated protein 31-like [Centruroides vittatus]|uniref:B-cell receptor-associated protein 31-like n=1 Tax=Centruroides vittatus TaxID=120091 RepID=UPI00350F115E
MSIQWTLIATFLYVEISVVILLLLPFISPATWQKFFKSRFFKSLGNQANLYFTVFFVILVLFFLDSIRETHKYGEGRHQEQEHGHLDAELQQSMRLFRAQRNFYIAGFALFLSLVIRRLVILISAQATLIARCDASMKQAQSATDAAEKLMKEKEEREKEAGDRAENEGNVKREKQELEIQTLKEELKKTKDELSYTKKDFDAMKSQAESNSKAYDDLMKQYTQMEEKMKEISGQTVNKKSE